HSVPEELVYSGDTNLTDSVEGSPLDAGKLVLSPTRTYAPIIQAILQKIGPAKIDGMIHCSGGAQTKILHFIDNLHIIKDGMVGVAALWNLVQEQCEASWKDMFQVFECGHRVGLYVDGSMAREIVAISESCDVDAHIVGGVEASSTKKVSVISDMGAFVCY